MTYHLTRSLAAAGLLALVFGQPAAAQWGSAPRDQGSARIAYDNGYRRGFEQGEKDLRDRREFDPRRHGTYRDGDSGYSSRYGPRAQYRQQFRSGYESGYAAGYRQHGAYGQRGRAVPRQGPGYGLPGRYPYPNDPYPNDSRYPYGRNLAFDNGYSDGYEKGIEDGRDNDRFDPTRHGWYKKGDRHYESRYGRKEQYKIEYREGFREGYEAAYREARAYRRNGSIPGGWRLPWPF